jgi:hypothetical protein
LAAVSGDEISGAGRDHGSMEAFNAHGKVCYTSWDQVPCLRSIAVNQRCEQSHAPLGQQQRPFNWRGRPVPRMPTLC